MKAFFVVVIAFAATAFAVINPIYKEWEEWKLEHKPHYASNSEEMKRMKIFAENRRTVLSLNKQYENDPGGLRFALNKFADLTDEEFASIYLHEIPADIPRPAYLPRTKKTLQDYPKEKNWVEEGAVTSVKDQGECGSCFAFSVVGNMEGVYKITNGVLANMSVQQVVNCDHECSEYKGEQVCDSGCAGGLMTNALTYAVKNGMTSWERIPYWNHSLGWCNYNSTLTMFTFKDWRAVNGDEVDMVAALNEIGPLSVGVDATLWRFYRSGLFSLPCGKKMNHGVLLVGYGLHKEKEYWLIKNSWGKSWGENGYILLAREKDKCGVDSFVNTIIA